MKEAFGNQHPEPAFGNQHSVISQNQQQPQNQNRGPDTPELRAEALVRRIGETCDELERLAKENPDVVGRVTRSAKEPKEAYVRLKQRLELADAMPRCRWIKQGGTTCGSPQMKNHIYCFAHTQMAEAQALALRLPPPEDANAIQVGLMRIQKALIEDTITTRKAGLLLYSMQLALTNVGQTTFGQAKDEELVLETVDEEEAFSEKAVSNQHSAFSQNQNQNQSQEPFTTEGTEGTEGSRSLPLINADERGLTNPIKPIEWKPTADMYRMDTREGMEAYEASFGTKIKGTKIKPRVACEPRPLQRLEQPGAEG
jgi:hypothetical protein